MSYIMTTNFNQVRPAMNDQQLRAAAPAIFAGAPESDVSERYTFIPTIDMVNGLRDNGWEPVDARQTKAQKLSREDTSLHMIRFRHPDLPVIGEDGTFVEAVLTNSHNRSSAYKMMLGAFRELCTNGLVGGDQFGQISIRHNTKVIDEAIAACFSLIDQAPVMAQEIERFKQIELDPAIQQVFARSAIDFKYGVHGQQIEDKPQIVYGNPNEFATRKRQDPDGDIVYVPVDPRQALYTHRAEDEHNSIWHVYNTIQENLIKGGMRGRSRRFRNSTTRGTSSISEDIRTNKALWSMATYLADHLEGK